MTQLLKAELLRLVSRRLLVVLLLGMAAMAAFGAAVTADDARPLNASDRLWAQESLDSDKEYWEAQCASPDATTTEICQSWEAPVDIATYIRTPIDFGLYADRVVELGLAVMLLSVAVLAASLVGAEFSSGNVGTQLLFTPRRTPLFISKIAAVVAGGMLLAATYLVTSLGFSAIMFLSLRGADDMSAGIELSMALGRTLVLACLIAVMAGSLAMAFGSTLVPFAVFAVTLLGSITMADSVASVSLWQLFLPTSILLAMIDGQHQVFDYEATSFSGDLVVAHVITYDWALGYSALGTALILLGALWWFRRRDILG